MLLRSGNSPENRQNSAKIKNETIEVVDDEITFQFLNQNSFKIKNENVKVKNESSEIVDSEISFHFDVRTKQEQKPFCDPENGVTCGQIDSKQETLDWFKTMVIIYQDLFSFDILIDIKMLTHEFTCRCLPTIFILNHCKMSCHE